MHNCVICAHYPQITQKLRNNYAHYAQIMSTIIQIRHKLRKNYAQITHKNANITQP